MSWLPAPPSARSFADWDSLPEEWTPLVESSRKLRERVHSGGHLVDARAEARKALERDDEEHVQALIAQGPGMRRAVLAAWGEDKDLARQTMTVKRIRAVAGRRSHLSPMGVLQLLTLHLEYFTSLQQWDPQLARAVQSALQSQAARLPGSRVSGLLKALSSNAPVLASAAAPRTLARHAQERGRALDELISSWNLGSYRHSEFGAALAAEYFLARIASADPSVPHDFLQELVEPALHGTIMSDGRALGHHAVEAMSRPAAVPCDAWIEAILAIAGDPRLRNSSSWFQWWREIDDGARGTVTSWLSRRDLELFLNAYENFIESTNLDDERRMFEDRKYFIKGLLEAGMVRETRLFMGQVAGDYVKTLVDRSLASSITPLLGARGEVATLVVIAMDCGEFQLVEGSHNFQLWAYTGPRVEELFDRSQEGVRLAFFRQDVPEAADLRAPGRLRVRQSFRHRGSTWQVNALQFLAVRHIPIPSLKRLMSPESYDEYRRIHGTPYELL
ncbi:EH signature domain-containing protein [Nesterenkonia suensis]